MGNYSFNNAQWLLVLSDGYKKNITFPNAVNNRLVFTFNFATYIIKEAKTMYTVKFNFEEKGKEPVVLENVEPGTSLLELALMNDIELHHNCGGVCACTTCHLYVEKGMESLEEITDREEDFIDRAVNPKLNSRLGCQSLLLDGDGVIEVTLPDQTQFLGE